MRKSANYIVAILMLSFVLGCSEQRAEYYFDKGLLAVNYDEYDDAIINYTKAVEILPGYTDARLRLSVLLIHVGRIEEAKDHLNYVVLNEPKEEYAFVFLGDAYQKEGDLQKAEEMYLRSLAINPKANCKWRLAQVFLDLGKYHEAELTLKEMMVEEGMYKNYHEMLASAYEGQGKSEEASIQQQLVEQSRFIFNVGL